MYITLTNFILILLQYYVSCTLTVPSTVWTPVHLLFCSPRLLRVVICVWPFFSHHCCVRDTTTIKHHDSMCSNKCIILNIWQNECLTAVTEEEEKNEEFENYIKMLIKHQIRPIICCVSPLSIGPYKSLCLSCISYISVTDNWYFKRLWRCRETEMKIGMHVHLRLI